MPIPIKQLETDIQQCHLCETELPLGPKPVVRVSGSAEVLIIGQAPGTRVHASGIPWNDPSGERLRDWMGIDSDVFYDQRRIAIVPMGFCYPGRGRSGDNPPSKTCAPTWHGKLLNAMPNIKTTLLIGRYAQQYYLKDHRRLTETVRHWRDFAPRYWVLPHPSPRNNLWLRRHPWFEQEVVPGLRVHIQKTLM